MAKGRPQVMVVGSGSIGRRHSDNLATLGAEVTTLSWQAGGMDGVLSALDRRPPQGAVIATATDIRLPLIAEMAGRGIPMYIEKPLAFRPGDVAAIYRAAEPVASRSLVGYMMRYHPMVRAMAAMGPEAPFRFAFEIGHDVTQWRQNWRFADSYAARAEGGGVLLDLCHELDMAHCLIPGLTLDRVHSLGHTRFPGVDMASQCVLTGPGGHGTVSMDYLSPVSVRRAGLRGQDAAVDADFGALRLTVDTGSGPGTRTFDFDRNDMFLAAMADFLAIAQGAVPPSGNPLMPRLDQTRASCDLIAGAWAAREFQGTIEKDLS